MTRRLDLPPGVPTPRRKPSPLTAALGLVAVAAVAVGAAWAGRASPDVVSASAVSAPARPVASDGGTLSADARTLLDGGNAAFRAGRYEAALSHYRAAAQRAPGNAAPWYGVDMAARKLGRAALAESALAAIRERTGAPGAWADSTLRRQHGAARPSPGS